MEDVRGEETVGRVRAVVGPEAEAIAADARALAALTLGGALADEVGSVVLAAGQLLDMVADLRPEILVSEDGGSEAGHSRLRHDLRTPLVALKGYGELIQEIAAEDGLPEVARGANRILEGVAAVLVAIERALPATSRSLAAESDHGEEAGQAPITGTILVADDSQANRDVLEQYLTREGHRVVAVGDGLAAVDAALHQSFDLVLLDMIMPGMNGDEVLRVIKAEPGLRDLPVIMISALDAFGSIVRCIENGAEDYLPKPFNRVLLRARIGACLEKKRLREVELSYLQAVEKELTIARDVQKSILPRAFPPDHRLVGHGLMVPAHEVGGDFYDYFVLDDDRIGVAVGDVSGKGVPAAVYMAVVRTQLRATARFGLSPAECLYRVNEHLASGNDQGMFASLFYGIVDCAKGVLTYANGGHNWPALISCRGEVSWLEGRNDLLVGVMYGTGYGDTTIPLAPGDSLFIFTDGVVEAFDPDERDYGRHRLSAVLTARTADGPDALCQAVLDDVRRFERGQPASDDLTCVALRYQGTTADGFEMRILPDLDEMVRLIPALEAHIRRSGAWEAGDLVLAVEEVVAAIIQHASRQHGPGEISIRVTCRSEAIAAEIFDDGPPFDASRAIGLGEAAGLGSDLIKTAVDGISYDREMGGNRLRLTKILTPMGRGRS